VRRAGVGLLIACASPVFDDRGLASAGIRPPRRFTAASPLGLGAEPMSTVSTSLVEG